MISTFETQFQNPIPMHTSKPLLLVLSPRVNCTQPKPAEQRMGGSCCHVKSTHVNQRLKQTPRHMHSSNTIPASSAVTVASSLVNLMPTLAPLPLLNQTRNHGSTAVSSLRAHTQGGISLKKMTRGLAISDRKTIPRTARAKGLQRLLKGRARRTSGRMGLGMRTSRRPLNLSRRMKKGPLSRGSHGPNGKSRVVRTNGQWLVCPNHGLAGVWCFPSGKIQDTAIDSSQQLDHQYMSFNSIHLDNLLLSPWLITHSFGKGSSV